MFIIYYYKQKFDIQKSIYPDALIKVDTIDGAINFKQIQFKDSEYGPIRIIISPTKFIKDYLNDGSTKDIVVPVYATSGGQTSWVDIFDFVSKSGWLQLYKMFFSYDLGYCKSNYGKEKFYPSVIVHKCG